MNAQVESVGRSARLDGKTAVFATGTALVIDGGLTAV